MSNGHTDRIIVKVILSADAGNNDSSIQRDWRDLLHDWAEANGCDIDRIEWSRLRQRFEKANPALGELTDSMYWDVVEEGK